MFAYSLSQQDGTGRFSLTLEGSKSSRLPTAPSKTSSKATSPQRTLAPHLFSGLTRRACSFGMHTQRCSLFLGETFAIQLLPTSASTRSYRDGSKVLLTPETSVQYQKQLGADIIIPFDELLGFHVAKEKLVESFERTHRWEQRSLNEHLKDKRGQVRLLYKKDDRSLRSKEQQYWVNIGLREESQTYSLHSC